MSVAKVVGWDHIVRLTHWLTASLFLTNYFVTEGGGELHQWCGYTLLASLFARLVWGVVGSPQARFRTFVPTFTLLKQYLASFPQENNSSSGHNPLGALMALFLWTWLAICGISGHLQETDMFWGEDWPEVLHDISSNILMASVIIHVGGVVVMQRLTGRALIKTMVTGKETEKG